MPVRTRANVSAMWLFALIIAGFFAAGKRVLVKVNPDDHSKILLF